MRCPVDPQQSSAKCQVMKVRRSHDEERSPRKFTLLPETGVAHPAGEPVEGHQRPHPA